MADLTHPTFVPLLVNVTACANIVKTPLRRGFGSRHEGTCHEESAQNRQLGKHLVMEMRATKLVAMSCTFA